MTASTTGTTVPALPFAEVDSADPAGAADGIREAVLADPGFGRHFTPHMVTARWTREAGWHDGRVEPYGPIVLDPAAAVLHYAQEVFEGLKAYRHADGSVWAFRPEANAERFARSARRLALPELPPVDMLRSLEVLVAADREWVPAGEEQSLYLRPFMFASEPFLGVRPADEVRYVLIASPAASYFGGGARPVAIWLTTTFTRAAPGGTGTAKCGGNYAAGLAAQLEAAEHGCQQVCFLDAAERRWVEELGGMNLFFVHADGRIVTPALTGTILEGITRSALLEIAKDLGHDVAEERVDVDDWRRGAADGSITEVFACGTAAVITPLGRLVWDGGEVVHGDGEAGPVTVALRSGLLDIQYGRAADPRGWMRRLA